MRTKKQIILIITIILILNLTILTTSVREEKTHNPFERFGLEYPEQEEIRTQRAEIRTTSQQPQEELKVIITLKEPEQIPLWRNQVRTFNEETKKELKDTMREYIIEKTNKENTRFKYRSFNGFSTTITQQEYEELLNNNLVGGIYENFRVNLFMNESVEIINASNVWQKQIKNMNLTGKGQTVCVIDTGIDYTHSNFGGCTEEQFLSGNCEKVIGGYNIYYNNSNPLDQDGHGTHVAGTIAANGFIKGVAPDANLVAVNVFPNNADEGTDSDIVIEGIEYCIYDLPESFNVSVISMSLGGGAFTDFCSGSPYVGSINEAVSRNISVVVATGNDNYDDRVSNPACVESAIRVGSTTKEDVLYDAIKGSNRWGRDMLLAPGVTILSTYIDEQYAYATGTSMATPHVAGAIAVLNQFLSSLNSSKTPYELNELLKETGKTIEADSRNYSRIDLLAAYEVLEQEYFNISLELDVSEQVIELFNGSVVVSWNASSKEDFNSSLFVYNSSGDVIFYSNASFGGVTLNSSLDSSSTLNWSGRYEVVFNMFNNFFNVSNSKEFFVKKHPVYELVVDDSSQGIIHNVSGDVIHGYFGEYNVSVFVVDAVLDNISLYFNNSNISFGYAENLEINVSGFFLLEANHSETDHYFFGSVSKHLNISDFPSVFFDGFKPSSPVSLEKDEVKTFSVVNASSEDGKSLNYSWVFSNETVLEVNTSESFVLNASDYSEGYYTLDVNVSNDFDNVSYSWNITIRPSYYLFFSEVDNFVLDSLNNLTINVSEYVMYSGDNFSVGLTNQSLNYSVSGDIITVLGSTPPGIYFTKINASINASGDLIINKSNEFQIFVSVVTLKKDFENFSVYSSQNLSINLSEFFLFDAFPVFNLTNENLVFEINESINEMIIVTNVSGNYSTRINASLGVSFAESNNFTIFVIDPFLSFNFSNNISDKSFEEGKSVTINLSNHFSFGGVNKEFSLTNSALSYDFSGEELTIKSNTPGTYNTKINASVDSLNNLSNEFKVTVTEKETPTSTGSDTPSSAPSAPSPSPLPPPSDPKPEEETTPISKNMRVLSDDSFINITKKKTEVHEKHTSRIYEAYHFVFSENVTNISLEFAVNSSWLEEEDLEPEMISLFYFKEEWSEAFTELKNVTEEVATYHSFVEAVDYYLVGEKQQEEIEMQAETTQTLPPREEMPKDKENNDNLIIIILSVVLAGLIIMIALEIKKIKKEK